MRRSTLLALLIVLAAGTLTAAAMRRTSTTFDEILLPAAGARGYHTGKFDLVYDHPPLLQYVYGLPLYLAGIRYPDEAAGWGYYQRYMYARALYWEAGNDPERVAFIARLMGVLCAAATALLVFFATRRYCGAAPALLAVLLVAFLPDMLAHGGISYNDVPLALAYFAAAWAIDAVVRQPRLLHVAGAAVVVGLAAGTKFSGAALAPLALALIAAEALHRGLDRAWWGRVALAVPVAALVAYLTLVAVYLGDFTLESYRAGFAFNMQHAGQGHGNPAVILGHYSTAGFWWYFPVAFLLKTPAGMHFLLVVAVAGLLARLARLPNLRARSRALVTSRLRFPLLASLVFLALSMSTSLNIGFRHVLPVLPGLCMLVAVGAWYAWLAWSRALRLAIGGAVAAYVVSAALAYPNYLGYLSEYARGRSPGFDTLVDSSYDWGQGLLALRDYMSEHGIDRVFLSYFGSALPEGYGIRYVSLPSFFGLPAHGLQPGEPAPRYAAISSTNLAGNYLQGSPFARLREIPPTAVLLGSMYVYELAPDDADRPQGAATAPGTQPPPQPAPGRQAGSAGAD